MIPTWSYIKIPVENLYVCERTAEKAGKHTGYLQLLGYRGIPRLPWVLAGSVPMALQPEGFKIFVATYKELGPRAGICEPGRRSLACIPSALIVDFRGGRTHSEIFIDFTCKQRCLAREDVSGRLGEHGSLMVAGDEGRVCCEDRYPLRRRSAQPAGGWLRKGQWEAAGVL